MSVEVGDFIVKAMPGTPMADAELQQQLHVVKAFADVAKYTEAMEVEDAVFLRRKPKSLTKALSSDGCHAE